MSESSAPRKWRWSIIAALLAVYLFWGGTYLAMKLAIETIPPFIMGAWRFLLAGGLGYCWELAHGRPQPKARHWRGALGVSLLLLVGGMGSLVWAEQYIPTGTAAIIFATVPLWMALAAWLFQGAGRPANRVAAGLIAGLGGVMLLVSNAGGVTGQGIHAWVGYLLVIFAAVTWSWGSLYSRTAVLPDSPLLSISIQNLAGGACYLVISVVNGEWSGFSLAGISASSALALGYLVVFGSLIGFGAYIWLLKAADPTLASTYAYVNPVVAVILGWAFAGERLTALDALAAAIVVGAVTAMTTAPAERPLPAADRPPAK